MSNVSEDRLKQRIRKIENRSWEEISSITISYPEIGSRTGIAPQFSFETSSDVQLLLKESADISLDVDQTNIFIPNLTKEGIFQIQKAFLFHSASMSSLSMSFGLPSLPLVYQSMYFCAEGIMKLHGVTKVKSQSSHRSWICDLFSFVPKKKISLKRPEGLLIYIENIGIGHKEFWILFNKVIRSTAYSAKSLQRSKEIIVNINDATWSRSRNSTQYHPDYWPFDEFKSSEKIVLFNSELHSPKSPEWHSEVDSTTPEYLVYINRELLAFSRELLTDLADKSSAFQAEHDLIVTL